MVPKKNTRTMRLVICAECKEVMAETLETARLRGALPRLHEHQPPLMYFPPVCAACVCTRTIARHDAAVVKLMSSRKKFAASRRRMVSKLLERGYATHPEPAVSGDQKTRSTR